MCRSLRRGKVIGVLNIESTVPNAYSERDENLLSALANSAAIALENARLYKSELARREQAEILRSATASLSTALELHTLYEIILNSVEKLIPYDHASIEIVKQGCLELVAERGSFKDGPIEQKKQKKAWESKRWEDWKDLWKDQFRPLILSDDQSEEQYREEESPGNRFVVGCGHPWLPGRTF